MKKWVKGILALSIIAGIGFGGNYLWSKTNHSRLDDSSIEADADGVERGNSQDSIKFEFTTGATSDIKSTMVALGTKGLNKEDVRGQKYSSILDKVKEKTNEDYPLLMKYFSVKSLEGDNSESINMIMKDLGPINKEVMGLNLEPRITAGYVLDEKQLEKNLEEKFSDIGDKREAITATLSIPYRVSDAKAVINLKQAVKGGEPIDHGTYTMTGAHGLTVSLEHSALKAKADSIGNYTLSQDTITFDGERNITVWLIPDKLKNAKKILYIDEETGKVIKKQVVKGQYGTEGTVEFPKIDGYELNSLETSASFKFEADPGKWEKALKVYYTPVVPPEIDDKDNSGGSGAGGGGTTTEPDNTDKEDSNNDVDTNIGNNSNTNTNNVTKSVTPFKVYGKQKLYRYSHANFTNKRRVQAHAKKVKAHAPVFTVVGKTTASNGAARYKLSDGTHITASSKYVGKLYWNGSYKKLHVTNPKGINTYKTNALSGKVKHVKQGATVAVKQISKKNGMTRYQLANGKYISGSKKLVSPTKPKQVKKVKAKTTVRLYKDVDLKKVVKTYKKGSVINVKGWDHSHGNVHHVSGYKRYKVAGGYITANSKYVKIAQ